MLNNNKFGNLKKNTAFYSHCCRSPRHLRCRKLSDLFTVEALYGTSFLSLNVTSPNFFIAAFNLHRTAP